MLITGKQTSKTMLRRNYILTVGSGYRPAIQKPIPKVVITVGIPTSGKTTWIKKNLLPEGFKSVSRDDIRVELCGKYKNIPFTKEFEQKVTTIFDNTLSDLMVRHKDIVLDNTHCKKGYIDAAIQKFKGTDYEIYVIFFDIPIWKAYLRNFKRGLLTGKWIPKKVIKQMLSNYKKINQNDYNVHKW